MVTHTTRESRFHTQTFKEHVHVILINAPMSHDVRVAVSQELLIIKKNPGHEWEY